MSIARSIRPLLAVTALSVLALTSCGGSGGAEGADGSDGGSTGQSQGTGSEGDGAAGDDAGSGEAYEVVSEHELIDRIRQADPEAEDVCVTQAYDQVTLDAIADFVEPEVETTDATVHGGGVVKCSIYATDAEGESDIFHHAGYHLAWNGVSGLPNVNCEDGEVDEEYLLEGWGVGEGDLFTGTAELIEDESSDAVYLYDPEGYAQMGLLCNADGSALQVDIIATEGESSPAMIEKVRTPGQLEPVMRNFAARIDSVNEHFEAIDQAAESQR